MPIVKIEKLYKDYNIKGTTLNALKNINLEIEKGDIYGIIGLSGAGKSTLVRCINLLEKPTQGKVYFNDKSLTEISKKELLKERQKIGMIFQNFNLLDQSSVLKNICYPLEIIKTSKKERIEKAERLLELVGLSDKRDVYPSQLSGGQKQRVAIARALANDPEVLLCDEPTSALDPTTTLSILELLKDINKKLGVTIIIITHEMKVIDKICNKVAIIDKSEIVESGLVKDIFQNPQTHIAKELIIPQEALKLSQVGERFIRITYDGTVSEPIIANMIITTKCEISILSSNIRTYEDKWFGQMIIRVPDAEHNFNKIWDYLSTKNVKIKEVTQDDSSL